MLILITVIHVLVCLFLIGVVLLQHGKSADIAATFGATGSQTAFGPRGAATVLSKATTWAAVIFMLSSITLSILISRRGEAQGVFRGTAAPQGQQTTPPPQQQPGQNPQTQPTQPPAQPQ